MPLTDREQELLRLLNGYLAHLHSVQALDTQTVEPFGTQDAAVQRWLQLAVQCCIDLGDSLLGRLGQPEPPRSRDIFPALVRVGVVGASLAQTLEQLTDYRNFLTHAYADLSPAETWRRVRQGLPAMAEFARRMLQQ
jgi:uncharacterized protein YutE (UPF0331/DUF86 family)